MEGLIYQVEPMFFGFPPKNFFKKNLNDEFNLL